MTINPRLTSTAFEPDGPRPQPLFLRRYKRMLDVAIFVLAVLAGIVLAIDDLAVIATMMISVIFIPIALPMLFAVPVSAALVPFRIAYGILRHRFDIRMSAAIAIPFTALCVNAIDIAFKYGPDGRPAAREIVANVPGLQPVTVPDHGVIAFRYDGPRWLWKDCPTLCQTLLNDGVATRIINIGRDGEPFQAFYMADSTGACDADDRLVRRSGSICEGKDPDAQTELLFDLVYEEAGPNQPALNAIFHVTVRSGAMVQHSKMVSAQMPTGGGLLAPYNSGNASDGYFAQQSVITIVPDQMIEQNAAPAAGSGLRADFEALVLSQLR